MFLSHFCLDCGHLAYEDIFGKYVSFQKAFFPSYFAHEVAHKKINE